MIRLVPSAVSRQHLCLAAAGLPRPGRGPLPGLRALLAAGLHYTCGQDERSSADRRPPHGTGGHSDSHAGHGRHLFRMKRQWSVEHKLDESCSTLLDMNRGAGSIRSPK